MWFFECSHFAVLTPKRRGPNQEGVSKLRSPRRSRVEVSLHRTSQRGPLRPKRRPSFETRKGPRVSRPPCIAFAHQIAVVFAPCSAPPPRVHLRPSVSEYSHQFDWLSQSGGEGRKSDLGPGHCLLLRLEQWAITHGVATKKTPLLCLLSVVTDSCSPQHFGSVFSCSQSGAGMAEKRRRSCRDTLAAPSSVNRPEVHSLEAVTQSGVGSGRGACRVPSGVLASLALCLASDFVRDPPLSLESTPKSHREFCLGPSVLGLGQLPAVRGSLRAQPRWLGPPPSTRVFSLFLCLLSLASFQDA